MILSSKFITLWKLPIILTTNTTDVEIASFKLSWDVAFNVDELMSLLIFRLKIDNHSLQIIDVPKIIYTNILGDGIVGSMIFLTDSIPKNIPINKIIKDIITPVKYSILWCPNGWSSSAGFIDILKPTNVIIELEASVKLLIPSVIIAILPETKPAAILTPNNIMLTHIPTAPARLPYLARTIGLFVSLWFLINSLTNENKILNLFINISFLLK